MLYVHLSQPKTLFREFLLFDFGIKCFLKYLPYLCYFIIYNYYFFESLKAELEFV